MSLHACSHCGGTLTDMFRFCPACGHDDSDWGAEPKAPLSFPVVERTTRATREPRPTLWTRTLRSVTDARVRVPSPSVPRLRLLPRARRAFAACSEVVALVVQAFLLSLAAARDALRSVVLVRKLHAQRAAVIYSTGCAALNGDAHRVRHARMEVELIDELIQAAAGTQVLRPTAVSGAGNTTSTG